MQATARIVMPTGVKLGGVGIGHSREQATALVRVLGVRTVTHTSIEVTLEVDASLELSISEHPNRSPKLTVQIVAPPEAMEALLTMDSDKRAARLDAANEVAL